MISSVFFQICSLFYITLLVAVYFSKRRLDSLENRIFIVLVISNMVGLVLDIASVFTIIHMDTHPFINLLVTKFYLCYLLTWISVMTLYIFAISFGNQQGEEKQLFKKYKYLYIAFYAIYAISLLLIFIFPLYYYNQNGAIYSYGPATSFLYGMSGFCIVVWIICMIKKFQNIKRIKCIPIFAYMGLGLLVMVIQGAKPEILLMTSMETFVTFLMYFTIENPDLKMINELNIARDQAEKANHAKTDFLSNMSHEIRTPLNAIVGFSQALLEEDIPEKTKDEVRDIVMASDNLLEIVNGILDISKIEANKLEIVNIEYRFKKIFDELVVLTKARMGDKALDFQVQYDHSIPEVLYGDAMRVKQIILNLLTNAIKYTPQGFVKFTVSSVKIEDVCRLFIAVEDSGIGIPNEKIDKLFTKFERLDVDKNNTIEGTGLGLAITKKLVELMNGKIVVQSVYGKGSKFTVALDQKIVFTPTIQKTQELAVTDMRPFDASSYKVLIVDDNRVNIKVAERLLADYQVQIESVTGGQECIDKILGGNHYDLILLDDMMPKMSGIQTYQQLRQIAGFNVPTVALTANAISGMKDKYLREGFQDYLAKPIERQELHRVLKKYLRDEE